MRLRVRRVGSLAMASALTVLALGCGREPWPDPPQIDAIAYQAEHDEWRASRQEAVSHAVQIIGLWPIQGEALAFGADPALPIVLPGPAAPARAGVFTRDGDTVTVVPAAGAKLRLQDGSPVDAPMKLQTIMGDEPTVLALGSLRLQVEEVFENPVPGHEVRRWVSAWDEEHPALKDVAPVDIYPLDPRWRMAAKFEAFPSPKAIKVADVRGGSMDLHATGQLVFQLNGQESRLTAFGFEGSDQLFVMFKDPTNASTTYGGYRILFPEAVGHNEWTVLDFNFASNPPCAYSRFTTCPLPPPENRLQVAIEAGEKRHPSAQGFTP